MNEREDYLAHYGILGMKWGIRRYQNYDGTLTAEGKKRIKDENKKAFELGRTATVYGKAFELGQRKMIRTENKIDKWYEKHPNDDGTGSSRMARLQDKWYDQANTTASLGQKYKSALTEAQKHCEELINKYGAENIKPISYRTIYNSRLGPHTYIDERIISGKDAVTSILATVGSATVTAVLGAPFGVLFVPKSASARAAQVYDNELRSIKQQKG